MRGAHGIHGSYGFWSEVAAGASILTTPVVGLAAGVYTFVNASDASSTAEAMRAGRAAGEMAVAPKPGTQTTRKPPVASPPQVSPGVYYAPAVVPTAPAVDASASLDQSATGFSVAQVVTAGLLLTAAGGALYWAFKG